MIAARDRLYLITDENLLARKDFLRRVELALAAGVGIIQLREKASRLRDRLELAKQLVAMAHSRRVRLLINDDPVLAKLIGADGVHLGKDDPPMEMARELLGPSAIIGVSCYADVARALEMERRGASYVSFGACFPSPTKPLEPLAPLSVFGAAKRVLRVPVYAIGGITASSARSLIEAGADGVAVVSSVFASRRVGAAVRGFDRSLKGDSTR